jgi:hypothetical protein
MSLKDDYPIEYAILCETLGEPTGVNRSGEFPGWGKKTNFGWYEALVSVSENGKWAVTDLSANISRLPTFLDVIPTVQRILAEGETK